MHNIDQKRAERVRSAMTHLLDEHGGPRGLSQIVGLSEPTIRRIAETGVVASRTTAAKIAAISEGELTVETAAQPESRGGVYENEPGLSILRASLRDGVSVNEVLTRMGIDHKDLWAFMNDKISKGGDKHARIREALQRSGIGDVEGKGE
jgi:hypothetical protein